MSNEKRLLGVICEFDPFHNGHARLLKLLREQTGCDGIVCAMSGSFTQRGEAAIVSKWARAEMALRCGADMVFELPALFAVRDAAHFARGGVQLLAALGVEWLGFGSESGDLRPLMAAADEEPDAQALRAGLARGESFARARGAILPPNDTLAVEYLRALRGTNVRPVTVRREGGGYHDAALGTLASATAIREALRAGKDVSDAMPHAAHEILTQEIARGAFQPPGALDRVMLARLRLMGAEGIERIPEVSEGLENRLLRATQDCGSRQAALGAAKCKRYTWARLSRAMTQGMLGMEKAMCSRVTEPPYARLLGFRREAAELLHAAAGRAKIPVETRGARLRETGGETFALEMRATDLWALGCADETQRAACRDLTEKLAIV